MAAVNTDALLELSRVRRLARSGSARVIREQAGLSRGEVAEVIDVSPVTVWRWEKGQRAPHGEAALRYLALLDSLLSEGVRA